MDADLRNGLWNCLTECYWYRVRSSTTDIYGGIYLSHNRELGVLCKRLWHEYFKKPLDTLSDDWVDVLKQIRTDFFRSEWHEVYDFVEFVANQYPDKKVNEDFIRFCNVVLEREVSAYRFVGGLITELTSDKEIAEVEQGLASPLEPIRTHLKQALDLYADRKNPDYRNSIKESISAVEAICRVIAKKDKATLSEALKQIEKDSSIELHQSLKQALDKLYGYTSDEDGIRHAIKDKPAVNPEDARFMLVCCSAFVNYLTEMATKAGIKL